MQTRRRFWVTVLGLAFSIPVLGETGPAKAGPLYTITNDTTTDTLGNPPFTLGFQFTEVTNQNVTALGIFDDSQNGLADSYPIGLWDSKGNLIASGTVLAGTADPLVNQFRYVNIAPVQLLAGQTYQLGALFLTGDDGVNFPGDATGFAMNPAAMFDQSTFASGGTLSNPTSTFSTDPGFFGPNLLLTPPAPPTVPEPSSLALLSLGGLGLAGWRRWKKRTTT